MKSDLPKVLHPLQGKPLIWHAYQAAQAATGEQPTLVIGYGAEQVRKAIGPSARYALQEQQLGTGHAVMQARTILQDACDQVLVTYGDMPLLTEATLRSLIAAQAENPGPFSMLTVIADDPRGFGRIVRGPDGTVQAIVEEVVATPEILAIHELNPGVYCFRSDWLWENLPKIPLSPKGEYFLTDLVAIAVEQGLPVHALVAQDAQELIGINTPEHLAEAEVVLSRRLLS